MNGDSKTTLLASKVQFLDKDNLQLKHHIRDLE
jgi:hypothetical protein